MKSPLRTKIRNIYPNVLKLAVNKAKQNDADQLGATILDRKSWNTWCQRSLINRLSPLPHYNVGLNSNGKQTTVIRQLRRKKTPNLFNISQNFNLNLIDFRNGFYEKYRHREKKGSSLPKG